MTPDRSSISSLVSVFTSICPSNFLPNPCGVWPLALPSLPVLAYQSTPRPILSYPILSYFNLSLGRNLRTHCFLNTSDIRMRFDGSPTYGMLNRYQYNLWLHIMCDIKCTPSLRWSTKLFYWSILDISRHGGVVTTAYGNMMTWDNKREINSTKAWPPSEQYTLINTPVQPLSSPPPPHPTRQLPAKGPAPTPVTSCPLPPGPGDHTPSPIRMAESKSTLTASEFPLLTAQKVGKVGMTFPTFI